ncbi:hypothetical protein HPB50_022683 [Hyalomma asiaticum]|uniref:Uncharacterized protein n=1 Tax=Hyalomma asiaticum TaxID=266040 RepID=A0ACB7T6E4_HYAAI|nr:hypothetical protein HPB50_022683 [Hyalomma asiaticum]
MRLHECANAKKQSERWRLGCRVHGIQEANADNYFVSSRHFVSGTDDDHGVGGDFLHPRLPHPATRHKVVALWGLSRLQLLPGNKTPPPNEKFVNIGAVDARPLVHVAYTVARTKRLLFGTALQCSLPVSLTSCTALLGVKFASRSHSIAPARYSNAHKHDCTAPLRGRL